MIWPKLVLGIAMHRDRQPVNARSQIIAAAAINIYGHVVGFRAQAAADVSLADAIEADEMPPAFHVRVHQQLRVAVVSFRRKMRGVNDQSGFVLLRLPQVVARFEINEPIRALGGIFGADVGETAEQPVQLGVDDVKQMAAFLRAGRVSAVVEQRQEPRSRWPSWQGPSPDRRFAGRPSGIRRTSIRGNWSRSHSKIAMPLPGTSCLVDDGRRLFARIR